MSFSDRVREKRANGAEKIVQEVGQVLVVAALDRDHALLRVGIDDDFQEIQVLASSSLSIQTITKSDARSKTSDFKSERSPFVSLKH